MTVIDFIKSAPACNAPTILDLVNALNDQILFAKGISDAILGVQEIVGDQCCMEGPSALIATHIEHLGAITAKLDALRSGGAL